MDKTVSFILGTILGAAGGSATTYFVYKSIRDADEAEREQDMADYYEKRCEHKIKEALEKPNHKEIIEDVKEQPSREDEAIINNEGVKKYHHDNGLESAYGSVRVFGEDAKPKKKESKLINEVSEQEFLNAENGYQKQTVDVFMSDDDDEPEIVGIWAYETDNEETVDKRFGKSIEQLLNGRTYDELSTYCDEDTGLGQLYLKNDELMIDFEFIIHDDGNDEES